MAKIMEALLKFMSKGKILLPGRSQVCSELGDGRVGGVGGKREWEGSYDQGQAAPSWKHLVNCVLH